MAKELAHQEVFTGSYQGRRTVVIIGTGTVVAEIQAADDSWIEVEELKGNTLPYAVAFDCHKGLNYRFSITGDPRILISD